MLRQESHGVFSGGGFCARLPETDRSDRARSLRPGCEAIIMADEPEQKLREAKLDVRSYMAQDRRAIPARWSELFETLKELQFMRIRRASRSRTSTSLLGRGISLDLDQLQAKLVAERPRQPASSTIPSFAAVLESLGFKVTRLAARVWFGAYRDQAANAHAARSGCRGRAVARRRELRPRRAPLPDPAQWDSDGVHQSGSTFRVSRDGGLFVLQTAHGDSWFDFYAFTLEPQDPVDFVVANHFTSTHPDSPFVHRPGCSAQEPGTRLGSLRNLRADSGAKG